MSHYFLQQKALSMNKHKHQHTAWCDYDERTCAQLKLEHCEHDGDDDKDDGDVGDENNENEKRENDDDGDDETDADDGDDDDDDDNAEAFSDCKIAGRVCEIGEAAADAATTGTAMALAFRPHLALYHWVLHEAMRLFME